MIDLSGPIKLKPARAWRTYTGGSRLNALHGSVDQHSEHYPEEWIMSVVSARNAGRMESEEEGLSFLENADLSLKSILDVKGPELLGRRHAAKFGNQTGVLIKLIDSSERLSVQVHPDREAAMRLFHSQFGKTECWHILDGGFSEAKPYIYFGFKPGISLSEWSSMFHKQDIQGMLNAMHKFEVEPGETYLIEGGVPHAIGANCFLLEIQEPTDYTIRTERITPGGLAIADEMCHQGLGFERMFECFHYNGYTAEGTLSRWKVAPRVLSQCSDYTESELIGYKNTTCFAMNKVVVRTQYLLENNQQRFFGLYVLAGRGMMKSDDQVYDLLPGSQFFIPASLDSCVIEAAESDLTFVKLFGPRI